MTRKNNQLEKIEFKIVMQKPQIIKYVCKG